jgi:hypothetical protein
VLESAGGSAKVLIKRARLRRIPDSGQGGRYLIKYQDQQRTRI